MKRRPEYLAGLLVGLKRAQTNEPSIGQLLREDAAALKGVWGAVKDRIGHYTSPTNAPSGEMSRKLRRGFRYTPGTNQPAAKQ